MVNCPNYKKELARPKKTWTYGMFKVQAYTCDKCNTDFREYIKAGKHSFILKLKRGKGFVKV